MFLKYITTSPNRAYLALCLRHFAQIPLRGTADTLRTLSESVDGKSIRHEQKKKHQELNTKINIQLMEVIRCRG